MDRYDKKKYLEKKPVAYYSGRIGLLIKDIEYGIDDYIICVSGMEIGNPKVHRVKLDYIRDGFRVDGCFVPLGECMRMEENR